MPEISKIKLQKSLIFEDKNLNNERDLSKQIDLSLEKDAKITKQQVQKEEIFTT